MASSIGRRCVLQHTSLLACKLLSNQILYEFLGVPGHLNINSDWLLAAFLSKVVGRLSCLGLCLSNFRSEELLKLLCSLPICFLSFFKGLSKPLFFCRKCLFLSSKHFLLFFPFLLLLCISFFLFSKGGYLSGINSLLFRKFLLLCSEFFFGFFSLLQF